MSPSAAADGSPASAATSIVTVALDCRTRSARKRWIAPTVAAEARTRTRSWPVCSSMTPSRDHSSGAPTALLTSSMTSAGPPYGFDASSDSPPKIGFASSFTWSDRISSATRSGKKSRTPAVRSPTSRSRVTNSAEPRAVAESSATADGPNPNPSATKSTASRRKRRMTPPVRPPPDAQAATDVKPKSAQANARVRTSRIRRILHAVRRDARPRGLTSAEVGRERATSAFTGGPGRTQPPGGQLGLADRRRARGHRDRDPRERAGLRSARPAGPRPLAARPPSRGDRRRARHDLLARRLLEGRDRDRERGAAGRALRLAAREAQRAPLPSREPRRPLALPRG